MLFVRTRLDVEAFIRLKRFNSNIRIQTRMGDYGDISTAYRKKEMSLSLHAQKKFEPSMKTMVKAGLEQQTMLLIDLFSRSFLSP